MYFIAGPSEVLAVTGCGIPDIKLAKKKWIWPGQKFTRVDISPVNYTFEVQAMSAEKLPFILPAVFTIGPRVDCEESMLKYTKLISPHDKLSNHVTELVQGVIEGETRVLAASMTMEQIFKGTKEFKKEVFDKVQLELDQFGLHIYNANVKQLVDVRGHEYFSYLGQKTQMEAANQARIVNEYNELLTTQLENQKIYFESLLREVEEEAEREISEAIEKAASGNQKLQKMQAKLDKCDQEKNFFDEMNKSLLKNQDILKASIVEIEERYDYLPLLVVSSEACMG
ncbi:hypothetical protein TEA_027784 [Camellia sinensis var. sinensis]|uniref:Flotillin-like n=1 Tax=Camellia sinensis var. sinensis TaxID=542762 RepID=A0A4S4E9T0_CAMSN|nr:hypothetical protein TEA_027784 [Camellia sinensis var. sinensis]